ncbi:sulfatase-like hydrolase/transferase [Lentisphaera profundi]|uniref:Sulfatase-like hydrolase/transferase n=1 Tax=Lentisphaera profundi TaxID=1658616 RepID=A0ABY7VWQ5_9BACT|nr:sulfatase-like hydrolase/transferase [Lentisphaera profundi]WDE97317.1 sulfatase-like hydrolase/transferase [Lentisphaera profundi]
MKKRVYWTLLFFTNLYLLAAEKPSVLLINVDDWNDWNEVLKGHPQAITPNIKRLAERGLTFSKAICASPSCVPSRPAFFTGIAPWRSGNISNDNGRRPWRFYSGSKAVTIPKLFSQNGWKSIGIAKNFHKGDKPEFDTYIPSTKKVTKVKGVGIKLNSSAIWDVADVPLTEMADYRAASAGIEKIQSNDDPLLLSVGIYRPHVPWIVPQQYFDKYPLESLQLPEARSDDLDDLPERFKLLAGFEAKFGKGYHENLVEKGYDKQFVRAYLASVTFADEQVGRLLDAWYASPHAETGYVVLWSDHGYMLGEKNAWSKIKPWYDSSRSNFIIAGPDLPKGVMCNKAVSLLDLYPTLIDLLGLPNPPQKLDGNSLLALLKNPAMDWDKPVQMTCQMDGVFFESILSNDYRMTRLATGETELYKLSSDPHEFKNLAANPEYLPLIKKMEKHLSFSYPEIPQDGWIEAEAIPAQTSADYKLRGNCHYSRTDAHASGGKMIYADLYAGKGSYIDFVLDLQIPGTYRLETDMAASGSFLVQVDDVKNEATQSDKGYPMKKLAQFEASKSIKTQALGVIRFDESGLKIIRFVSKVPKQQIKFDRLRLRLLHDDQAKVTELEFEAPKKQIKESKAKSKGNIKKNTWASQAQWNKERPGLEWVFTFMDKNGDGMVDSSEYKALQEFKKKYGKKWQVQARKELESKAL